MFAVVRIPGFALQAVLRVEPQLAGRPAVLIMPAKRGTAVAACNDPALAAGVRVGHPVPRAQARCPDLVMRPPHPGLEREAEAALLAAAFLVTPYVELTSPGIVTLGLERLPEERRQPAMRAALNELAALQLPASGGLGSTPLQALYAARRAVTGDLLVMDDAFLAALPLAAAEPSDELAAVFATWGLKTLGQLTALTKADITHRFGLEGLALWERASGETSRPLQVVAPARDFTAEFISEHEMETLEPLLFIMRRCVDRLALELRQAHAAALVLELELGLVDETRHARSIRLPEPVTEADLMFRALHTYLETLRTPAAVLSVRLRLETGRITVRQHGLFEGGLRDPHGFSDTLARVAAMVGSDRVGRPVCADTHRPDAVSLAAPPPVLAAPSGDFMHAPQGLALRRYRSPLPATIELSGRAPAFVWTERVQGTVQATSGPWYFSGDWWESARHWQREEWDVELKDGGVYRLVRTPTGWLIEGEYD